MNRASSLQLDMFFSVKSYILANERLTLLRRRKYILLRERCFDVETLKAQYYVRNKRGKRPSRCYVRKKKSRGKLPVTCETTACVIIHNDVNTHMHFFSWASSSRENRVRINSRISRFHMSCVK